MVLTSGGSRRAWVTRWKARGTSARRVRIAKKTGEALEKQRLARESEKWQTAEARLRQHYQKSVVPALVKEFGYKNVMAVPKIQKVSVNIGLGEATQNAKLMDGAVNELGQIAGQKPVVTKAKKSIAAFKLREGMSIGSMVTLRGDRMYEFLDRLMNVALPRVRDFRGVSSKSFDGRGNYTLGVRDQLIFPEIDYNKVEKVKGMNISITTTREDGCRRAGAAEAHGDAVQAVRRQEFEEVRIQK